PACRRPMMRIMLLAVTTRITASGSHEGTDVIALPSRRRCDADFIPSRNKSKVHLTVGARIPKRTRSRPQWPHAFRQASLDGDLAQMVDVALPREARAA